MIVSIRFRIRAACCTEVYKLRLDLAQTQMWRDADQYLGPRPSRKMEVWLSCASPRGQAEHGHTMETRWRGMRSALHLAGVTILIDYPQQSDNNPALPPSSTIELSVDPLRRGLCPAPRVPTQQQPRRAASAIVRSAQLASAWRAETGAALALMGVLAAWCASYGAGQNPGDRDGQLGCSLPPEQTKPDCSPPEE